MQLASLPQGEHLPVGNLNDIGSSTAFSLPLMGIQQPVLPINSTEHVLSPDLVTEFPSDQPSGLSFYSASSKIRHVLQEMQEDYRDAARSNAIFRRMFDETSSILLDFQELEADMRRRLADILQ